MQGQNTVLKLTKYSVKYFEYNINDKFKKTDGKFKIPFNYQSLLTKIDDDNVAVEIKVDISNADDFPFALKLTAEGQFNSENWEQYNNEDSLELRINTILFPYIRALITTLTSAAEVSPIRLPVMNVAEMIRLQRNKEKHL